MAKKRSSNAVAAEPSRPSKKRKSAEASKAKIKEIAEAEEVAEAEQFIEMKEKMTVEVKEDEQVEEVQTVVAPGFRVWNTTSKMTAGGELAEASTLDMLTQKHSMLLDIQSEEAFTLKPLVVTQGPYKGCRVFMLESGAKFRFFDFPAEIRNLVYSFLVEEDEPIKIDTHKVVNEPRRPVRDSYRNFQTHVGFSRDRKTAKWDQPPSTFTILRTSKKVFQEVAPLMYGNNRFHFDDLGDLKVFLDRVNSMRQYIRHIEIGPGGFLTSKARSVFASLKDTTHLRKLSFHYSAFREFGVLYWSYSRSTSPEGLVGRARNMLQVLHRQHKDSDDNFNIVDLIKIEWSRCSVCVPLAPEFATDVNCKGSNARFAGKNIKCKDSASHCKEIEEKIRKQVAKLLNIKDAKAAEIEEKGEENNEVDSE